MLSKFRKKKLTYFFNTYDFDKDGYIELEDYARHVDALVEQGILQAGSEEYERFRSETIALWNYLREYADQERDERVSLAEWLKWQEALDEAIEKGASFPFEKYVSSFFDAMDTDNDGKVSVEEYGAMLKSYGFEGVDVESNFRLFDKDGDGFLSREEVIQLVIRAWLSDDPEEPENYIYGKF